MSEFPKLICVTGKYNLSGYEDTEKNSYLRVLIGGCEAINGFAGGFQCSD